MKILITGATGLIGQEIAKLCHQSGIEVNYLTTHKNNLDFDKRYKGYLWDPKTGKIDHHCFEGVEVIINLAGATIAKRWTSSYKKQILESRVKTASLIYETLKTKNHAVRHIISASAIGIYQDSFQNYYTEDDSTEKSTDFLGEVVQKWEASIKKFETINIEVSLLRIGLVLSKKGGAFPEIIRPIRYGLGAFFGNGKQWQSWIHVSDLARMFFFVLQEELTGVFNAVAPNPVSNKKITIKVAQKLNKIIWFPGIPRFFMRMILGEMHVLLYASQRVSSDKISSHGFDFDFDNISLAVDHLVDK